MRSAMVRAFLMMDGQNGNVGLRQSRCTALAQEWSAAPILERHVSRPAALIWGQSRAMAAVYGQKS